MNPVVDRPENCSLVPPRRPRRVVTIEASAIGRTERELPPRVPVASVPPWPRRVLIALTVVLLPLNVLAGARTDPFAQALAGLSILVLAAHAVVHLGMRRAALFAAVILVVTMSAETVGVATGFPFGRYAFLVAPDLPRLGAVPIIVGPLYAALGYCAWVIACLLLDAPMTNPPDRAARIGVPIMAAFVLTQWDLVMDPPSATVERAWVWLDGGGYFGVPLTNFLGWFGTTWIAFQIYALLVVYTPRTVRARAPDRLFVALPILFYLGAGLCHLVPLSDSDRMVADGAGTLWSSAAIREAAAAIGLFTMVPTAVLALLRLARRRRRASAA